MSISDVVLCAWLALLATVSSLQTQAVDSNNIFVGTVDNFPTQSAEYRLKFPTEPTKLTVKDTDSLQYRLYNGGWWPVQESLLLTEYPKEYASGPKAAFCEVSEPRLTVQPKAELSIANGSEILDDCISDNQVYFVTHNFTLYNVEITSAGGEVLNLVTRWTLDSLATQVKRKSGLKEQEAITAFLAFHNKTKTLYVATDKALVALDGATGRLLYIENEVYKQAAGIFYIDIVADVLFVGFKSKGVYIYDIHSRSSVGFIGILGAAFFNVNELNLKDFEVQKHQIEFINQSSNIRTPENYELRNNADFSKLINLPTPNDEIMYVADEKEGVFAIDISELIHNKKNKKVPTEMIKIPLPLKNTVKIARFNNAIYAMSNSPNQFEGSASQITEIFVTVNDSIPSGSTPLERQTFRMNRRYPSRYPLKNIYVDEGFLYMMGNQKRNRMVERGVPSNLEIDFLKRTRRIDSQEINTVSRLTIQNQKLVVTIGPKVIKLFELGIDDSAISCPLSNSLQYPFGEYKFQLNLTLAHCPQKLAYFQSNKNVTLFVNSVCVLTKEIIIDYRQSKFYERKEHSVKITMVLFLMLVLSASCLCFFYLRHKLMDQQYKTIRKQIDEYKHKTTDLKKDIAYVQAEDQEQSSSPSSKYKVRGALESNRSGGLTSQRPVKEESLKNKLEYSFEHK